MKRQRSTEPWDALLAITDAAERFVNRSPRSKRLEAERQALLDAIRQAQLLLSVKRFSTPQSKPATIVNFLEHQRRQASAGTSHKRRGRRTP